MKITLVHNRYRCQNQQRGTRQRCGLADGAPGSPLPPTVKIGPYSFPSTYSALLVTPLGTFPHYGDLMQSSDILSPSSQTHGHKLTAVRNSPLLSIWTSQNSTCGVPFFPLRWIFPLGLIQMYLFGDQV